MSDIGDEELCELVCSRTLDGYTPNPLYTSGACPDYMKNECNADGTLWHKQWDLHQDRLKLFNTEKVFHASLGVPTQVVSHNPYLHHQPDHSLVIPPTSAQVFAMVQSQQPQQMMQQQPQQMRQPQPQQMMQPQQVMQQQQHHHQHHQQQRFY